MTATLPLMLERLMQDPNLEPPTPTDNPPLSRDIRQSVAADLQQHLLPTQQQLAWSMPKWLDVAVYHQPRQQLSGDFYWAARLGARGFVAVGDTSANGLPGVLQCVQAQTFLSHHLNTTFRDLPTLLQLLDMYLSAMATAACQAGDPPASMDLTLLQVRHDRPELHLAAAAHHSLLVRQGGELEALTLGKFPLGEAAYQRRLPGVQAITMQPGDTLYIGTDGYYGQLHGNRAFCREKLWNLFRKLSANPDVHAQMDTLAQEFLPTVCGQRRRADDWTVMVLRANQHAG